ncbi:MAG: PEP-CTERM sorting domain-containing protein [Gallionellaceae bacterium]
MRTLYSFAILLLTAVPAFASPDSTVNLPEPSVIGLIGIGALAFLAGRRGKK